MPGWLSRPKKKSIIEIHSRIKPRAILSTHTLAKRSRRPKAIISKGTRTHIQIYLSTSAFAKLDSEEKGGARQPLKPLLRSAGQGRTWRETMNELQLSVDAHRQSPLCKGRPRPDIHTHLCAEERQRKKKKKKRKKTSLTGKSPALKALI